MNLQDAIAEVQRRGPDATWHTCHTAVMNAAVAGDLIPEADAEQAVALVYDKIAREVGRWSLSAAEEILALAPADALAEVQRWKAALESIARNTCCDGCQEAALVARAALGGAG